MWKAISCHTLGCMRSHEQRVPHTLVSARATMHALHTNTLAHVVSLLTHKSTYRAAHIHGILNNCKSWIQGHHAQSSWCLSHIVITCTFNKINQSWWKSHHTLWGGHNDYYPRKVNSYTWAYSRWPPSTSVIPRCNLLTKHGCVLEFELCTEPMTQMSPAATAAIWNIMSF